VNTLALGVSRATYETRVYFRQGDTIFFTFLFPIVMLSIFSVALGATGNVGTNPDGTGGVTQAAYYLPGMVAAGILLSGVQNLAVDIALERGDGTLKRLVVLHGKDWAGAHHLDPADRVAPAHRPLRVRG
jgi:ABC-2 type transport system permease protein